MAASESSFSSETEGSSSKDASGKSQVSGKNILYSQVPIEQVGPNKRVGWIF
jgi:hypothetical protein